MVTGVGIGSAIALAMGREGVTVAAVQRTTEEVAGDQRALAIEADWAVSAASKGRLIGKIERFPQSRLNDGCVIAQETFRGAR